MKETEIKAKLLEASKAYCKHTALRASVNLIPHVGSSLDILFAKQGQEFISNRIETFITELRTEILNLKECQINKEYFESEEGFDLILQALNYASKTRQSIKLKLFAQIVSSSIINGKKYSEDEPELFLKIAEELSVKEFQVALCLYELKENTTDKIKDDQENNKKGKIANDAFELSQQYSEFQYEELISILVRLERTGLVKELIGTYIGYVGGKYLINQLFKRFMTFLMHKEE